MSTKKLRSVNWFWSVDHEINWQDSTDFDHLILNFDNWKVIYIDCNGMGRQKNFDIYPCFRYIKFDISEFI